MFLTIECLAEIGQAAGKKETKTNSKFSQILRIRAIYSIALFLLLYVGIEGTLGGLSLPFFGVSSSQSLLVKPGWTVTFIMNVRHGGPSSGYISSAFFGGKPLV